MFHKNASFNCIHTYISGKNTIEVGIHLLSPQICCEPAKRKKVPSTGCVQCSSFHFVDAFSHSIFFNFCKLQHHELCLFFSVVFFSNLLFPATKKPFSLSFTTFFALLSRVLILFRIFHILLAHFLVVPFILFHFCAIHCLRKFEQTVQCAQHRFALNQVELIRSHSTHSAHTHTARSLARSQIQKHINV